MTATVCPMCDGRGYEDTGRTDAETGGPVEADCGLCGGTGVTHPLSDDEWSML